MFNPVVVEFKGDKYEVPANKVLGLIASIEEHANIVALNDPSTLKYTSLAKAYAAAIWYAGGKASVDDVYAELFNKDGVSNVRAAIANLVLMMVPPSAYEHEGDEGEQEKKTSSQ